MVNQHAAPGDIAAVEFNVSCHNVNFDFEPIVEQVLRRSGQAQPAPGPLKLSPDYNYVAHARLAERYGVRGLIAINTVKGLRLDPETGEPLLKNRFGGLSGRAIKPIGLRVVAELRDAGIGLPIIATGGIRTFDDCRESFWAGADAVSLGSEVWLAPYVGYALGPLRGLQIGRLITRVEGYERTIGTRPGRRGSAARNFRLRSGATSSYYIDKYLFETQPALLRAWRSASTAFCPAGASGWPGRCSARCRW